MSSLKGKVAIITGSSRSIGAAVAKHLGAQGAKVVVNYVNDAAAAASVVGAIKSTGGDAVAVQADASTIAGGKRLVDEAVKAFGGIDIVVLNAGIMGSKVIADIDEEFFDAHFAANVKGPFFLAKAVAPLLPSGGRIIFFSSTLTVASVAQPNAVVYIATKAAVEQFARILAKDPQIGGRGITVNAVSPGPVDTPLFRAGKPPQVIENIIKMNPLQRLGEVDDIAPVVAFLASSGSGWVNGQNLRANGGYA